MDKIMDKLCCAAKANNIKRAQYLLCDRSVHPDAVCSQHTGTTALHIASVKKYMGIVELLITNEHRPADVNKKDQLGETALHNAIWYREDSEIAVKILRKSIVKVDLQAKSDSTGHTYFETAILRNKKTAVQELIRAGADVNVGSGAPLTACILLKNAELAQVLLEHGCNMNIALTYHQWRPSFYDDQAEYLATRAENTTVTSLTILEYTVKAPSFKSWLMLIEWGFDFYNDTLCQSMFRIACKSHALHTLWAIKNLNPRCLDDACLTEESFLATLPEMTRLVVTDWVEKRAHQPPTLLDLCKMPARRLLGQLARQRRLSLSAIIKQLHFPEVLKPNLLFVVPTVDDVIMSDDMPDHVRRVYFPSRVQSI